MAGPAGGACGRVQPAARGAALGRHAPAHRPTRAAARLHLGRPRDTRSRPAPTGRELSAGGSAGVRPVSPDRARGDGGCAGGGVKYFVRIGAQTIEVQVEGTRVLVGGEALEAHLVAVPGAPLYHLLLGGQSWTVAAQPLEGGVGRWALGVVGERVEIAVVDVWLRQIQALTGGRVAAAPPGAIRAPMPGLVVRVEAEPGHRSGRSASRGAQVLRGKHKPKFTPHINGGDCVIVVNAEQVKLSGRKMEQKRYFRHTGYMGHERFTPVKVLLAKHPERVIEKAVWGMLPKTTLSRQKVKQMLKVYAGPTHPHAAQQPQPLALPVTA